MPSVWRPPGMPPAQRQRAVGGGSSLLLRDWACPSAPRVRLEPPDAVRHLPSKRALALASARDQPVDGNRGDDEHAADDQLTVKGDTADYKTVPNLADEQDPEQRGNDPSP